MAAYLIGHMTIHDRDAYLRYRDLFFPIFQRYGGELVAFDDGAPVLEGHLEPGRTVILRFPDRDTALAWFHSDGYQSISEIRRAGVNQHFITIIDERPAVDEYTD